MRLQLKQGQLKQGQEDAMLTLVTSTRTAQQADSKATTGGQAGKDTDMASGLGGRQVGPHLRSPVVPALLTRSTEL